MTNLRKTSSFLSLLLNTLNSTTLLRNLIEYENEKEPAKDNNWSKSIITYSSIDEVLSIITNEDYLFSYTERTQQWYHVKKMAQFIFMQLNLMTEKEYMCVISDTLQYLSKEIMTLFLKIRRSCKEYSMCIV